MRRRNVTATVVGSLLVAVAPAWAAPSARPVCMLITDPAGDAQLGGVGSSDDGLDILSGDVASGKSAIVAALRLKSGQPDANAPGGRTFELQWTVNTSKSGSITQLLQYHEYANAGSAAAFYPNAAEQGTTVDVPASLDPTTGALVWRLPRRAAFIVKGARFTEIEARSYWSINLASPGGTDSTSSQADGAVAHASYVDATPSCLKGT